MAADGGSWDLAFAKARRAKDVFGVACLATFGIALALALWALLHAGFSHVSDDDFARTVIAEEWVASVRGFAFLHELPPFREHRWARIVDPSGTSWLPFPFWVTGLVMTALGRSIEVARGVQMAMVAGATVLLARALLRAKFGRVGTACVLALGFANPYALWLSASQTPDAWVALLAATALVSLLDEEPDAWAAAGLLAATLSRYETWPIAAVFAARYLRSRRRGLGLVPIAGPALWMAWNAVAHGSPLHFFTRVVDVPTSPRGAVAADARCVRAHGVRGAIRFWSRGPGASGGRNCARRPGAPAPLGVGAAWYRRVARVPSRGPRDVCLATAPRPITQRARSCRSRGAGAALFSVAYTELMQRVQIAWGSKAGAVLLSALIFGGVLWSANLLGRMQDCPGRGDADRRSQIDRGGGIRPERPAGFDVQPCRYEHLALLAAYGAPERVRTVAPPPPTGSDCPAVLP